MSRTQFQPQLERLYMAAPVGLCYLDLELRYVHINKWLADINGLPVEAHIGRTIGEVLPEVAAVVEAQFRKVIEGGEPMLDGIVDAETPAHPGETRHFLHNYFPDRTEDGEIVGIRCAVQDITERIVAEQAADAARNELEDRVRQRTAALTTSESRLRLIADSVPALIAYVDTELRFQFNNALYDLWFGRSPEELRGTLLQDLVGPTAFETIRPRTIQALAGYPQEFELEVACKDRLRLVHVNYIPNIDDNDQTLGFFALISDITGAKRDEEARRRLERQSLRSQRMESLGVLAGGIAHDFNNLLVSVLGHSELALEALPTSSPARPLIERAMSAGQQIAKLSNQMLNYSGKGGFVFGPTSLNAVIRKTTAMAKSTIPKHIVIVQNLNPTLPAVLGDATQLQEIALSLLMNALEAIGESTGRVDISTGTIECDLEYLATTSFTSDGAVPGTFVYMDIADSGCGMDDKTRERIFEPFFTTKFTGRGLGLATVIGIVRGHNGTVSVSSSAGEGAVFRVLLPATEEPAMDKPVKLQGSGSILLVDDDESVLDVVGRMLTNAGFNVVTANGGESAVRLYRDHQAEIACVILDLTMPQMDGHDTFLALREICDQVPVVISSGYPEREVKRQFTNSSVAGFIMKPYLTESLLATIRAVLDSNSPK